MKRFRISSLIGAVMACSLWTLVPATAWADRPFLATDTAVAEE